MVHDLWDFPVSGDMRHNGMFFTKSEQVKNMLYHGVIVEVRNPLEATMAEKAGAKAVLVTRGEGLIMVALADIMAAVKIPVIASVQAGQFVEAGILETYGSPSFFQETKVFDLGPHQYINKHEFDTPFVCECTNFYDAVHSVLEGGTLLRIQGKERRTGDIADTVKRVREMREQLNDLKSMDSVTLHRCARELGVPYNILQQLKDADRPPVLCFASGGISTVADAALMMELGCDGVFVSYNVILQDDHTLKEMVLAVENFSNLEPLRDPMLG